MRRPTISDTGSAVTLDLHGARVHEAEDLVLRVAELAARRGRSTLRVVYGASTTDRDGANRTVKTAVLALLDAGELDDWVASEHVAEGHALFGLTLSGASDPRRITLADVRDAPGGR